MEDTTPQTRIATIGRGRIVSGQGWPVPGATATVLGSDGEQLGRATADDEGDFTLQGLPATSATLLLAAPGYEPRALSVVIPEMNWDLGQLRLNRKGATVTPAPGVWVIDPAHSTVAARAQHLGMSAVTGRFTDFTGVIVVDHEFERSTVDVQIQAASITTGTQQRDDHLRSPDFLDVTRFPTLSYRAERVAAAGTGWQIPGALTMIGVQRPITLAMTYQGSGPDPWGGTRAAFAATTVLRRSDFEMNWNQAVSAGVAIFGTTLQINLDVQAVLQPT